MIYVKCSEQGLARCKCSINVSFSYTLFSFDFLEYGSMTRTSVLEHLLKTYYAPGSVQAA